MPTSLDLLVLAGNPLILLETADEASAVETVRRMTETLHRPRFDWSLTTGLRDCSAPDNILVGPGDYLAALDYILRATPDHSVHVFRDLGLHSKEAKVQRRVRDIVHRFHYSRSTLILIDGTPLAHEVRRFGVRHDIPWPTTEELELVVRQSFQRVNKERVEEVVSTLTRKQMEQLVQALRGLTPNQAERILASVILDDFQLDHTDIAKVVAAKRDLLGTLGSLETITVDVSVEDIGGLANLKRWLKQRRDGYSKKARDFGLEPPRGLLMLGVPGCGKSLCAKAVAADWNMPLVRLDPGVLYQKFIGESESQLRQALAQAEAMAPAVLWIDEIEKAFASASANSADGGLSQRMFGTLLSWMQDHRHPIFIIATANDIAALPPELMRKGRFDEVFFVDLPSVETRAEILAIHLARRKRDAAQFDLKKLAAAAEEFSGSELEQAVIAGLFRAFSDNEELTDKHLLAEIQATRPLAKLSEERVRELRSWAEGRCVRGD